MIKTKIVRKKGRSSLQVIQDLNNEPFDKNNPIEIMCVVRHDANGLYKIMDYRYTDKHTCLTPYLYDMCGNNHRMLYSKYEKHKHLFTFPFKVFTNEQGIKLVGWNDLNGILIDGADMPYKEQDGFKRESHVWSYKEAMKKIKEAKEFWDNFDGDDLESAKVNNLYKRPDYDFFTV